MESGTYDSTAPPVGCAPSSTTTSHTSSNDVLTEEIVKVIKKLETKHSKGSLPLDEVSGKILEKYQKGTFLPSDLIMVACLVSFKTATVRSLVSGCW